VSRYWYLLTLLPAAVLTAIASLRVVRLQVRLTSSGSASRFDAVVAKSGGKDAVVDGLYLDLAFIIVFVAVVPAVLHAGRGWWAVPVIAASLDLLEDGLALVLVQSHATDSWSRVLWILSSAKLLAYLATVVAVVWAVVVAR
jgi:hypothetical protein